MSETPQIQEIQEKWEPIDGIETPAARASIVEDREGLTVTLVFPKLSTAVIRICD